MKAKTNNRVTASKGAGRVPASDVPKESGAGGSRAGVLEALPEVQVRTVQRGRRTRWSFAKIPEVLDVPHLIEVQLRSYQWFIKEGIKEVFEEISPIQDFTGNLQLEFLDYYLEPLKYSEEECRDRDCTYSASLKVRVRRGFVTPLGFANSSAPFKR